MLVEDIMTKNVIEINSNETIFEACKKYTTHKVGSLIVKENDMTVGILTERDIIQSFTKEELDIKTTKINEVMSRQIKSVHVKAPIEKAAEIMEENNIKKLPVVLNNKIVGMITETDITRTVHGCTQAIEEMTQFYLDNKESMEKMIDDWGNLIVNLRSNMLISNKNNFDESIEEIIQINNP